MGDDNGVVVANADADETWVVAAAAMAIVASRTSDAMACGVLWNGEGIINVSVLICCI